MPFRYPLEERNHRQFWIGTKKVIETQTIENERGQREFIVLTKCRSCSRVLHDVSQIAALCWICDGELCEKHVTECSICGQVVCSQHSQEISKEKVACKRHGFLRKLYERRKK